LTSLKTSIHKDWPQQNKMLMVTLIQFGDLAVF